MDIKGDTLNCAVCLQDLTENTEITKCNHMFHSECIAPLRSCPYCRTFLKEIINELKFMADGTQQTYMRAPHADPNGYLIPMSEATLEVTFGSPWQSFWENSSGANMVLANFVQSADFIIQNAEIPRGMQLTYEYSNGTVQPVIDLDGSFIQRMYMVRPPRLMITDSGEEHI